MRSAMNESKLIQFSEAKEWVILDIYDIHRSDAPPGLTTNNTDRDACHHLQE